MITLTSYEIKKEIHAGEKSSVYRATKSNKPVIIKVLSSPYPDLAELNAFRHEYETLEKLNSSRIIKVIGFEKYKNSIAIIFEDIYGEALSCIISEIKNFSVWEILDLMIKSAEALGEVHELGLVHKDIKSHNIVFNKVSGELQIIDFGNASQLKKQNFYTPLNSSLEGTLAYISPEQTGRMNRTVDYRTDYYSLGVTFYQLLTGELPFICSDPMELVHAHIAKTPIPPINTGQVDSGYKHSVYKIISDIVMKLLQKNPEDRYQSITGLVYDLEWCKANIEPLGNSHDHSLRDDSFQMGTHDFSGKFRIPEKLYGRNKEVMQILETFKRMVETHGRTSLLLISGRSGIGKSVLINEVNKPITQYKGYFASGKYEQFKKTIPYRAITQSFQSLIQQILTGSQKELFLWKETLLNALGQNGQVVIDVIPELENLIGEQPPVMELGPAESQNRFNLVFQNFIGAFCKKEHPIAIFLDDLQWADTSSINLIYTILSNPEIKYLYLILSFRDNEVLPTDSFSVMLGDLKKSGFDYEEILLCPISTLDITHLVADTLSCKEVKAKELGKILFEKTKGNPFFVNEVFKSLYDKDLIEYSQSSWNWDISKIREVKISENVLDLLVEKVRELTADQIAILKISACIGNSFELSVIAEITGKSYKEIKAEIDKIANEGFLVVGRKTVRFVHDKVQEATYLFLSADEKAKNHYAIGNIYLKNIKISDIDEKVFAIVNQLNQGIVHVTGPKEKTQLQELNTLAGKKALSATAYEPALLFFKVAMNFLPKDKAWEQEYEKTLELTTKLAEAEYLNGNFENSERLINTILEHAKTDIEKGEIYRLLIVQYTLHAKYSQAIDALKKSLDPFNIFLPESNVQTVLEDEIKLAKLNLGNKEISSIYDAPEMTNPESIMAVKLLTTALPASYISNPLLWCIITLKATNLCLLNGNIGETYGYACYGILSITMGEYKAGYAFCKLAVDLSEKFNNLAEKCKASNILANYGNSWVKHIRNANKINQEGFQAGLDSGEFQHASYITLHVPLFSFYSGQNLVTLLKEMNQFINFSKKANNHLAIDTNLGVQLIANNLSGKTENARKFSNIEMNEQEFLSICILHGNLFVTCLYKIMRAQVYFLYERYSDAFKDLEEAEKSINYIAGEEALAEYNYYYSLILAAMYAKASIEDQLKYLEQIKANQKQMKIWAESCNENFLHKFLLVEAEIARIESNNWDASKLYDESILEARKNDFIQNEAVANELAAKFWLKNNERFAQDYLVDSYKCYEAWGAVRKCELMLDSYPELKHQFIGYHHSDRSSRTRFTRGSLGSRHNTLTESVSSNDGDFLDLNTVVKASQAISGDIQLGKLLETMMKILFENAGAERGFFILKEKENWIIEAGRDSNSETISVLQAKSVEGNLALSPSIVNYVVRTKSMVLLNDATKKGIFINDEYVKAKQPKSILCYPIINHGNLVSVVYLENNLTTDAFTPERVEILKVLSSQIAVSVENSLLYENLEEKVEERTRDLNMALVKVHSLKEQQDGDYFLNTLLIEPLGKNNSVSPIVGIDFFIKQKKTFSFKKNEYELGGDINISESIQLQGKKYIVFLNGDAMGKSIQGAGGVLVLGTVFKSIIQRTITTSYGDSLDPERWLKNAFIEMHKAFESFDGFMLMSAAFGLIDEKSGTMYFMNAEHPDIVLYRNGSANFIQNPNRYTKLGTQEQIGNISVQFFSLIPGDIIILGSDGRDDIIVGVEDESGYDIINRDETLFLSHVKNGDGNLEKIYESIVDMGKLTDDLSMLRIHYKPLAQRIGSKSSSNNSQDLD